MILLFSLLAGFTFAQNVELDGTFRYRQGLAYDAAAKGTRVTSSVRGAVGATVNIIDDIQAVAQITTAGNGTTSNYESLGGNFADKAIALRLAYVDWNVYDTLHVYLGKMENPFYVPANAQLMWDEELSFDGLAATYSYDTDDMSIYMAGSAFIINENGMGVTDEYLLALQAGVKYDFGRFDLNMGAGYYDYTGRVENGNPYMSLLEVYGVFGFNVGMPLSVYIDWSVDVARPTHATANEAYLAGLKLGQVKNDWDFEYLLEWHKIKNIGFNPNYSNSEFLTASGSKTDVSGFVAGIKTQIRENLTAGIKYYLTADETIDKKDFNYHTVLLDLTFNFNKIF